MAPVRLEIDTSRNIALVHTIPYHLCKSATSEFNEMIQAGILVETKEATEWCSQAFPVQKPGSDPIRCRWVSDFRKLNKANKRPNWGNESSSQLLRHPNF